MRSRSSPCSGRTVGVGADHCGPPIAPKQHGIGFAGRARSVAAGSGSPCASIATPPKGSSRSVELVAEVVRRRLQAAQRLRDDFRPDAIAGRAPQCCAFMRSDAAARSASIVVPARSSRNPSSSTPLQQAVARERSSGKLDRCAAGQRSVRCRQIDADLGARMLDAASALVLSSTTTGSRPFFSALLRKMSAISVLMTARKP